MKSYFLESIPSSHQFVTEALNSILPKQSSPWILLSSKNDAIAYFNIENKNNWHKSPSMDIDISGRHHNEDRQVFDKIVEIKRLVGGAIKDNNNKLVSK